MAFTARPYLGTGQESNQSKALKRVPRVYSPARRMSTTLERSRFAPPSLRVCECDGEGERGVSSGLSPLSFFQGEGLGVRSERRPPLIPPCKKGGDQEPQQRLSPLSLFKEWGGGEVFWEEDSRRQLPLQLLHFFLHFPDLFLGFGSEAFHALEQV